MVGRGDEVVVGPVRKWVVVARYSGAEEKKMVDMEADKPKTAPSLLLNKT